jgi:hypothetical protein
MSMLMDMTMFLFWVWFGLSPIIWAYWHYHPESQCGEKLQLFVGFGTFFGLSVITTFGVQYTASFLPEKLVRGFGVLLGLVYSMGYLMIVNDVKILRIENEDLKRCLREEKVAAERPRGSNESPPSA